jgi:multicomponent Na+:H+ antiporter subunit C
MILRRSLVKILVGLLLLGYAVNLLLFSSANLTPGRPPILPITTDQPVADPVPQALILTAIVISFGMTAFAVSLVRQVYQVLGTDDTNELRCTDLACEFPPKEETSPDEELSAMTEAPAGISASGSAGPSGASL